MPLGRSEPPAGHREAVAIFLTLFLPFYAVAVLDGLYVRVLWTGSNSLYWIHDILKWVLLPCLLLVRHRCHPLVLQLRVFPETQGRSVGTSLLASLILMWLAWGLAPLVLASSSTSGHPAFDHTKALAGIESPSLRTCAVFYSLITAGVIEETWYRGILLHILARRGTLRQKHAIVGSLLFSAAHWELGPEAMVSSAVVGLLLSQPYIMSGGLLMPMLCHMSLDLRAWSLLLP
jgi:membrane protease YdiL (CAAX protease family)